MEIGKYIQQNSDQWGKYKAFIPNPFPPKGGFGFSDALIKKDAEAQHYN